jgi:hypothetical protein
MFIVFYQYRGEDLSIVFNTIRAARKFAKQYGGRIESRLTNLIKD